LSLHDALPIFILISLLLAGACKPSAEERMAALQGQAETFLTAYNKQYQQLYTDAAEAEWTLNTKIVEGDSVTQRIYEEAKQKFTDFLGSQVNIDSSRRYLELKEQLTSLQSKQFEAILFAAGGSPESASAAVKELIKVT